MRSRFMVARKPVIGTQDRQHVALGIDLGMSWTKLAKCIPGAGCEPCSLGDKEVGDQFGEKPRLRGVTETVGTKGARYFKPLLQTGQRTLDTGESVEQVVRQFLGSVVTTWLLNERGIHVSRAAVTCPVSFNLIGRMLLARCMEGVLADSGFREKPRLTHMLPEPVAVIVAQDEYRSLPKNHERMVVVYDLGGATFDAALVHLAGSEEGTKFTVRRTAGLRECGVYYFDEKIRAELDLTKEYPLEHERTRLNHELCRLRRQVSKDEFGKIEAEKAIRASGREMSAARIRELLTPDIQNTAQSMSDMLAAEGLRWDDIDAVLLNGGGSLLWFVPTVIEQFAGDVRVKLVKDPIRDVARGAAFVAGSQGSFEVRIPFPNNVLLDVPEGEEHRTRLLLFRKGDYPDSEGIWLQVSSQAARNAVFALYEETSEFPTAAFYADLREHSELGERLRIGFTVDSKECTELYGSAAPKGALLTALEAKRASGVRIPVKATVDIEDLRQARPFGWTLEEVGLRIDLALLLDATESARRDGLPEVVAAALEEACEDFVEAYEATEPSITVRVIFYGDRRLGERCLPQKPCTAAMLQKVISDGPRYVGGDAEETPTEALERLAEAWRTPPDPRTLRLAFVCCDADDADLAAASWEENAPQLERLRKLLEETQATVCLIGEPRGWLGRWFRGLKQETEVIPYGNVSWVKTEVRRVLQATYERVKQG